MAVTADAIWENGAAGNTWIIAWRAIAYALEIYFDFAGYSDMAIGLGRMLGFHFNENFNLPISHRAFPNFGADGIFRYLLGFGVMFTSRWEAIENIYI